MCVCVCVCVLAWCFSCSNFCTYKCIPTVSCLLLPFSFTPFFTVSRYGTCRYRSALLIHWHQCISATKNITQLPHMLIVLHTDSLSWWDPIQRDSSSAWYFDGHSDYSSFLLPPKLSLSTEVPPLVFLPASLSLHSFILPPLLSLSLSFALPLLLDSLM